MSAAEKPKLQTVRPLGLRHTAAAVARNYGDKGAIVITYGEGIVRIGCENLSPLELREILCAAISYSYISPNQK